MSPQIQIVLACRAEAQRRRVLDNFKRRTFSLTTDSDKSRAGGHGYGFDRRDRKERKGRARHSVRAAFDSMFSVRCLLAIHRSSMFSSISGPKPSRKDLKKLLDLIGRAN
jgi:hypothetical protein